MNKLKASAISAAGGVVLVSPFLGALGAQAQPLPHTVYVSTHGVITASDKGCDSAAYKSISAAVSGVDAKGTVIVCGGTFRETVSVAKAVTLQGRSGATIDATNQNNGVTITASGVTISGLTVENAIGEGILANGVSGITIAGNVVKHNDLGALPTNPVPNTYPFCAVNQGVPGDCGEGIHLMGTSNSTISGNTITGNSGGVLVSDETGPAAHNRIAGNVVTGSLTACGITIVGHNPAAAPNGVPAPSVAGVFDNDIVGNISDDNGLRGAGAGVVLATGAPGGAVYNNTVEGNVLNGNALSGVTVHSHVAGEYLNGNVIRGNQIGTNNLNGDPDFAPVIDSETTGIVVATVSPLSIEITGNLITNDHFGVWTTGPVTAKNVRANAFAGVSVQVSTN
ncbi:right-handed parallel beta-helix repeat-containing protein [Rugosimonospora acidiphila]|uniref:Right-handed parallel beta-helix repeat-containing protein n=1 Tax=Rugosimonospora acidiphila TaxID=556531 RepID=A0ABP9SM21_9ACTN